jgi:hypothetical protein
VAVPLGFFHGVNMTRKAKRYKLVQERFVNTVTLSLVAHTATGPAHVTHNSYGPNGSQITQLEKMLGGLEILKRQNLYSQEILSAGNTFWNSYHQGQRILENYTDWMTFEELLEELDLAGAVDLKNSLIRLEV